jgi:hypothetical protein
VFLAARAGFVLDETGLALAGKWAASLFSAAAAALLYLAIGRRRPHREALWTAIVFALGTSVWSTSQALWQHPAAVFGLCAALLCMVRAEADDRWAGRAGLPLALTVAARYADIALVVVLAIGVAVRWPRRIPYLVAWAAPVAALVLAYHWAYFGSPLRQGLTPRFSAPWGEGHLGLLVSPGKGLFVFTPIALIAVIGLVRALRYDDRVLAVTCGAAALAHWLFVGRWAEWHGGESWGPRLMTDALPLLFLFLPDGYDLVPRLTVALGALSVAVQALGAFTYDYRWERLRQRPVASEHPELWDVPHSPIVFYAARRLVLFALPRITDGKVEILEHPIVLGAHGHAWPSPATACVSRARTRPFRTCTRIGARASRTGACGCAAGGTACSCAPPRGRARAASSCAWTGRARARSTSGSEASGARACAGRRTR